MGAQCHLVVVPFEGECRGLVQRLGSNTETPSAEPPAARTE
jgi:hypothetical protein